MSKILVTGGAGFIGSNLVDALVSEGHKVIVADNLSTGLKENINEKAVFFEVDITDKEALEDVFVKEKPEAVFHLAAQASVIVSAEDPAQDVAVNVVGTINLLKNCTKYGVKKFIFSSTGGAIYGDETERPTVESAIAAPVSPYGIDKLCAEHYIKFFTTDELQCICLRYANVYGPRQNSHGEAGVVAIFSTKMIEGEPVQVYGDGSHTRDFVYVGDIVAANMLAFQSELIGTFNIGTGLETSVNGIVELLQNATSSKSAVNFAPYKAKEQAASCLSAKLAQEKLAWQPTVSLEEGISRTVAWFKDRAGNKS